MNIIRIANGDYGRYEELLLQRDQLEKEACQYMLAYTREFGDLITESFKLKVDCIAIKKSIGFCQAAKNHSKDIDPEELQAFLNQQMAAYQAELRDMIQKNEESKKGTPISAYQAQQIKAIYRRVAKMLHPDISPLTKQYPELADLFQRVMIAYQCNDLKELQELEVMINKALADNGVEKLEIVIPDVAEKILELEKEIERILNTEPYLYKGFLADEEKVSAKKQELEKEIEEYKQYKASLESGLKTLIEGGEFPWEIIS